MDAGGERDLGPPAVERGRAVGGQLGEELGDLGLVGGGGGALVPAVVAGEGGVHAPDVARAPRVHPDAAVVAAHHLLAVVEGDAARAVHRPGAVHPVVGGRGGGGGSGRGQGRGRVRGRGLRAVQAAALHRRRGG